MVEREVNGQAAAMGAADEHGALDLQMTQEREQIVGLRIYDGGCRGTPVAAAVVTNGVELLAECGPDAVPNQ